MHKEGSWLLKETLDRLRGIGAEVDRASDEAIGRTVENYAIK
jgi:hypothetical protein